MGTNAGAGAAHKTIVNPDERVINATGKYNYTAFEYEDELEFLDDFNEEELVEQDESLMNAVVGQYNGILEARSAHSVSTVDDSDLARHSDALA